MDKSFSDHITPSNCGLGVVETCSCCKHVLAPETTMAAVEPLKAELVNDGSNPRILGSWVTALEEVVVNRAE